MSMRTFKRRVSLAVRERVMRHYRMPFSRAGLEAGLVDLLPQGRSINLVDIGASSGDFAQTVNDHCGVRNALLIEPQPARVSELLARFPYSHFSIEQCAIADSERIVQMDVLNWHYSSSLLPLRHDMPALDKSFDFAVRERVPVCVRTLDEVMSKYVWRDEGVDLLKVDVQGGELSVLCGAQATLRRVRSIWTEVAFRTIYEGGALFSDI